MNTAADPTVALSERVARQAERLGKSGYGRYLRQLLEHGREAL